RYFVSSPFRSAVTWTKQRQAVDCHPRELDPAGHGHEFVSQRILAMDVLNQLEVQLAELIGLVVVIRDLSGSFQTRYIRMHSAVATGGTSGMTVRSAGANADTSRARDTAKRDVRQPCRQTCVERRILNTCISEKTHRPMGMKGKPPFDHQCRRAPASIIR